MSINSLYNYEDFYNIDPVTLEEDDRAKAFIEEEKNIEQMLQKLHNLKKNSVVSVDPKVLVNPVTGRLDVYLRAGNS